MFKNCRDIEEMEIALVLPGSIWYAPYVRIYTRILDEIHADYSIISWNREGDDDSEGIQYNVKSQTGHCSAGFSAYKGYVKFIKKSIHSGRFDRIIVFGPQMTCLLSSYLLLHFRGKYMIDYRDLSIEQKPGLRQLFSIMLKFSCANVISSPGFKRCLPNRSYLLSHNFDVTAVRNAINNNIEDGYTAAKEIDILTIGAIRDFSSNIEVVKALANKELFKMRFVGKGKGADQIAAFCKDREIKNISFVGFYKKDEEEGYVKSATFMNIFYPRVITHDTALSNRFYNSLIYKKPMIVTKNTTQGDFAEQYNVGVALENCNDLDLTLFSFLKTDYHNYAKRCNELLKTFLNDQEKFEKAVVSFSQN